MGRHHKPADLSSSSSDPASLNRSLIMTREFKRYIWWPASKIRSVIQLAVVAVFLTCSIWCLCRLPEDHDEYPDGFRICPDSSYKILDDRNMYIRCKPCLECPVGQQLLPPCGSTTQSETSVECRKCPPGTYKESQGIGKCKPCQTCGLRETISQCSPERNTLCGKCPRGYYQDDYTLDSCKRCSTSCGVKRFAELEFIYLKQCARKNCTQQLKIEDSSVLKSVDFAKLYFAAESTGHERAVTQQSTFQTDGLAPARNWVVKDNVRIRRPKKAISNREVDMTMQSVSSGRSAFKVVVEVSTYTPKGNNSNPTTIKTTTASVKNDDMVASLSTLQSKLKEGFGTTLPISQSTSSKSGSDNKVLTVKNDDMVASLSTLQSKLKDGFGTTLPISQSTSSKSGSDNKVLTILIVLIAGFMGIVIVLILIGVIIVLRMQSGHSVPESGCTITCCPKYISIDGDEYQPFLHDTSLTDSDSQQIAHISNNGVDTSSDKSADTSDLESLALSELSLTLESEVIKRLDVRHKGEYGWRKLGNAFEVDKDDLKYLETAYQRSVGSPTKELLEILDKNQCRTVGEVLNKLKGSYVNRPDVAQLICQKWQNIKYSQARK